MLYLDSSKRTPDQSLGYWIEKETATSISHLRLQTGYFSINGLSVFGNIIGELTTANLPIYAVIGSNERDTLQSDIENLVDLVGCPRPKAKVSIVSYSGGLFHPKVIHLTRTDGSQLAYVGSANLTPAGVGAGNIEAGILLDTYDGDSSSVLNDIASRIDGWFSPALPEARIVSTRIEIQKCVDDGILGIVKQPRLSAGGASRTTSGASKPILTPLMRYPPLVAKGSAPPATGTTASSTTTSGTTGLPLPPISSGADILIAEIGGGPRWKQANFPIAIMQGYFGVNPISNDHIKLHEVENSGAVNNVADTLVVNVKSRNYRMELSTVSGIIYPTTGRPIGIFRKIAAKEFRYRIFMPSDTVHPKLDGYLNATYKGRSHHLKRLVVDQSDLASLWPACPV